MDYSSETAKTLGASDACYDVSSPANTAASLAPCKLPADEATLVTFATGSNSKITFVPGALIPGQTYEVSVDEGAFVGASTVGTTRASAAFSTRFYVAQTVAGCEVGAATTGSGPKHRSSAIKITFAGPVHVDDSKSISIGKYSSTDEAYTENHPQSLSGWLGR